jgi:hypothetical protein
MLQLLRCRPVISVKKARFRIPNYAQQVSARIYSLQYIGYEQQIVLFLKYWGRIPHPIGITTRSLTEC